MDSDDVQADGESPNGIDVPQVLMKDELDQVRSSEILCTVLSVLECMIYRSMQSISHQASSSSPSPRLYLHHLRSSLVPP